MYEKYPISGIKQSYRHTREVPTVVMPILIGLLLFGMVAFFIKSKPEETAPPQEVVSIQEETPSLSLEPATKIEATPDLPKSDEAKAEDATPAETESNQPQESTRGVTTVSAPIESTGAFTAWMTPLALDTYIRQKNKGYSESFWQRGHWITAVEGRWNNGSREFRIALDKVPDLNRWQWQYRVNQSSEDFVNTSKEFAEQGFELVQTQTFKDVDGSTKFQAVWQREVVEITPVVETSTPTSTVRSSLQPLDVNNLRFR